MHLFLTQRISHAAGPVQQLFPLQGWGIPFRWVVIVLFFSVQYLSLLSNPSHYKTEPSPSEGSKYVEQYYVYTYIYTQIHTLTTYSLAQAGLPCSEGMGTDLALPTDTPVRDFKSPDLNAEAEATSFSTDIIESHSWQMQGHT